MATWAISLLLATVLLCGCTVADYGWPSQKEFSFSIKGENLAGLPQLKQQFAGFRYQGEVRVQSHTSRVLLIKMFNMNYTKIHEELPNGWWRGVDSNLKNKTKIFPVSTSTIVVKMTKSMSPEIIIQSGLDTWQENFIKGIVSNLLVYINENPLESPNSNRQSYSTPKDTFAVMEDSVVGRCEVIYEVSRLPKEMAMSMFPRSSKFCDKQPLYEITKTRNFSNCQLLNEDHGHLPMRDCTPGGDNCGTFWTRSSLSQMIGCGEKNNLMLLRSVSVSVINTKLHLQNNSQAVVNSNVNITLLSALDLKQKFNPPQNTKTLNNLLYSYSTTPKVVYSRSCQETTNNSNEDQLPDESTEEQGSSRNHKNGKGKNRKNNNDLESGESENSSQNSGRWGKDKSKKRGKNSNESSKPERQSSAYRYTRSLKRKFSNKQNEQFPQSNENNNGYQPQYQGKRQPPRGNFNPQNNKRKNTPWQMSSEEGRDQPSEELQLEDQWKISGKEQKSVPPHQPFHMFTLAHRTSYDLSCLNPKLRQIVADVASDLQDSNILPEKHTLAKLSLAVDICRSLPLDQLQVVSEEVFEVHSGSANIMKNNERKVYRDIVTMCGTHPALQLMRGWIERRQVEGEEAAQMIASFPTHVFTPTTYLVQDFFEMVQQISREDKEMASTAILALTNLVRASCTNPKARTHLFSSIVTPVCDKKMAVRVADWLKGQFSSDSSSDSNLTRVYIEALGNLGTTETIDTLKEYILGAPSSYLKTSAVYALRYHVIKQHPEISPLLLSLYHNYSLPASTRIAAVGLLVYSDPGLATWQRLAISTYYEPSWEVSQFVASTLRTMATSKDTLYNHMTKSAFMVHPLSRPAKMNPHMPYNLVKTQVTSDFQRIVMEQITWQRFFDFTNFYYRHSSRDSGFYRTNIEASLSFSNMYGLWDMMKEMISSTYNTRGARPLSPSRGVERTLSWIRESLDLYSRNMPTPQAELHLKVNNMLERIFLVNKETIRSWAKDRHRFVFEGLAKGKSVYYQKSDMDCFYISTTTEMGFPVEFAVRAPWIVNGMAELNVTMDGLQVEASLMYSSQLLSSVGVMSSWDNIAHTAGAYATNFVQIPPLRMTLNLDNSTDKNSTPTEAIKLSTSYVDQHRLLYFSMQPFTSQRKLKVHQPVLLSPDTLKVKIGEPRQVPITWMSKYLNSVYSSEQPGKFNPLDLLRKARPVVGFPMMMPDMEPRSFETVMNPLYPITMNLSMSSASKSMGLLEIDPPKDTVIGKLFNFVNKIMGFPLYSSKKPSSDSGEDFGDSPRKGWKPSEKEGKSVEKDSDKDRKSKDNDSAEEAENSSKKSTKDKKDKNTNRNRDQASSKEQKEEMFTTTEETTSKESKGKMRESSARKQNRKTSSEEEEFMDSQPSNEEYQVYSTTYESISGNFNASEVDPFGNMVNGSSHTYLIEQILDKIVSGKAVVLGFNMITSQPEQPSNISAYAAFATTYSQRAHRIGLFLKKDSAQGKVTISHEHPIDLTSDLKRRVTEDLMHKVFVDYDVVSNGKDIKLYVKSKFGASREVLQELMENSWVEKCSQHGTNNDEQAINPKCQSLLSQAKEIGAGNITVYYNDGAKGAEKFVEKYLHAANLVLDRTEEKQGEGSNTMHMSFDVKPRTQAVDTFMTTPSTSLHIYQYPLSKVPMSSLLEWVAQISPPTAFCGISPRQVRTFDNAEIKYRMKDNWYLVARDCSDKYGFSVIAQPAGNNSMMMELNINDHFVISMKEGPSVSVNNKLQPLDENHALMVLTDRKGNTIGQVVHTPDHSIHVQLPGHKLDMVYSQTYLIIKGNEGLQGRMCGLCGSYSSTGIEKFMTAHGSMANSPQEFLESYIFKGSKSGRN